MAAIGDHSILALLDALPLKTDSNAVDAWVLATKAFTLADADAETNERWLGAIASLLELLSIPSSFVIEDAAADIEKATTKFQTTFRLLVAVRALVKQPHAVDVKILLATAPFCVSPFESLLWRNEQTISAAENMMQLLMTTRGCSSKRELINKLFPLLIDSVGGLFKRTKSVTEDEPWSNHIGIPAALVYCLNMYDDIVSIWPRLSPMALQMLDNFRPYSKIAACHSLLFVLNSVEPRVLYDSGLLEMYFEATHALLIHHDMAISTVAYPCVRHILIVMDKAIEQQQQQAQTSSKSLKLSSSPVPYKQRQLNTGVSVSTSLTLLRETIVTRRLNLLEEAIEAIRAEQNLTWLKFYASEVTEQIAILGQASSALLKSLVPCLCRLVECGDVSAQQAAIKALSLLMATSQQRIPFYRGPILRSIAAACVSDHEGRINQDLTQLLSKLWGCCSQDAIQEDWALLSQLNPKIRDLR